MSHENKDASDGSASKGLSRRQFVKAGALGTAALGVAAAVAPSFVPGLRAAGAPTVVSGSAAAAVPSAATQISRAQPMLPSQWDVVTDVVVVGSGAAGFAAAIEAHDAGASVVILEKETQFFGGNALLSGGN